MFYTDHRKELNMMKKTARFNFTGAAVSTCLWRGVMVHDILLASGLQDQPDEERWYEDLLWHILTSNGATAGI